jgi:hypothetical protein
MRHSARLFQDPGPVSTTQNLPAAKTATQALARSALGSGDEVPQSSTRSPSSSNRASLVAASAIARSIARSTTPSCTAGNRMATIAMAAMASSRPGSHTNSRCIIPSDS